MDVKFKIEYDKVNNTKMPFKVMEWRVHGEEPDGTTREGWVDIARFELASDAVRFKRSFRLK